MSRYTEAEAAMNKPKKRILFTGYAQVHFVCFLPVYRLLAADPSVDVFLSGGFRRKDGDSFTYELKGFYDPFPVDKDHVISLERVKSEHFDVLVSAHLSDTLFPKSVGKKVQIFHGVSIKNLAVRAKALRYDMLCLPGRYHAEQYRLNGLIRDDRAECFITGFPKTDALVGNGFNRDALLSGMGLDPALPTILFAPTGEKYNALDVMGKEVVEAISKVKAWNLLVKPHDHPKKDINWFTELASFESGAVRLIRDTDISPYLHAADLLITDMSSVAVEYTLMDRPIIFLDIPKLMKRVEKRSLALDLDTYGRKIGSLVSNPDGLEAAIKDSLANPDREGEVRRNMAAHLFYAPGKAASNVAGVVSYAAGLADGPPEGVVVLEAKE